MELAKAIFIRVAGVFWIVLFAYSGVLFVQQPAEIRFLGAMLSGLAPLGFFLYVHLRPQSQLDIEMTLTGAFCFAMNLIVTGDVFLNSKPETYLPALSGFGLLMWLVYNFWVPKYNLTIDHETIEELKKANPATEGKTAYILLTGPEDAQCLALLESYQSESDNPVSKNVFFVLNTLPSQNRFLPEGQVIILNNKSAPVRYCSRFPLSPLGHAGLVPGILVLEEKKEVVFQKVWPDVRKRQDIRFVFRLLE